ncbi:MAG: hypothetical protein ACR2PA_03190 [Hyphomicrobiaceae bacterium]
MIKTILKVVLAALSLASVSLVSYGLGVASGREQTVQSFLESLCF